MAKRKKKKKTGQAKAANAGLEGFVDWTNPRVSESTEEEKAEMSVLVFNFSSRICKRVSSAQGLIAPGTEVPSGKRPKLTSPDEEA